MEKLGIKETKEAIAGVNMLAIFLIKRLKDGAGIDDAFALFSKLTTDKEFKSVLGEAYDGISKVPAEMKDIDLMEGLEIAKIMLDTVPKYIEAFKKEE